MYCTECGKVFIAALDYDMDGCHVVECPHCRHEHCRVVKGGRVTEERWSSRVQRIDVPPARVWRATNQPMATGTAAAFLRQRWLNRDGYGDSG